MKSVNKWTKIEINLKSKLGFKKKKLNRKSKFKYKSGSCSNKKFLKKFVKLKIINKKRFSYTNK